MRWEFAECKYKHLCDGGTIRWWYFPQQYGDHGMEPLLQARADNAEVSDVLPAAPPAQELLKRLLLHQHRAHTDQRSKVARDESGNR